MQLQVQTEMFTSGNRLWRLSPRDQSPFQSHWCSTSSRNHPRNSLRQTNQGKSQRWTTVCLSNNVLMTLHDGCYAGDVTDTLIATPKLVEHGFEVQFTSRGPKSYGMAWHRLRQSLTMALMFSTAAPGIVQNKRLKLRNFLPSPLLIWFTADMVISTQNIFNKQVLLLKQRCPFVTVVRQRN